MKKTFGNLLIVCLFILLTGCGSLQINRNEKISKYFTMGDAVRSRTASIRHIDNSPSKKHIGNIKYMAKQLDKVRDILRRDIVITNWYRNRKLNRVIGGSDTSAHLDGLAADVVLKKGKAGYKEFDILKNKMKTYDQLIYYPRRGHVHIGFRRNKKYDRKIIMINNKK